MRYRPYAFTEHGIMMLASMLKSDTAVQVSVRIVDAFVAMRRALMSLPPLGIPELVAQGANQDCEQTLGGLADEEN